MEWSKSLELISSRSCGLRDTDEASKLARKESKRSLVSRISTFPADMDETWKADIDIPQTSRNPFFTYLAAIIAIVPRISTGLEVDLPESLPSV